MSDINQKLAAKYMQRVEGTGLIGTARDQDAIAFWVGAAYALLEVGKREEADDAGSFAMHHVIPRGFAAVMELLVSRAA